MGVALEAFLTVAVPIAFFVGLSLTIFRQPLRRLHRYFRAWRDRDLERESEEVRHRLEAEREIGPLV